MRVILVALEAVGIVVSLVLAGIALAWTLAALAVFALLLTPVVALGVLATLVHPKAWERARAVPADVGEFVAAVRKRAAERAN